MIVRNYDLGSRLWKRFAAGGVVTLLLTGGLLSQPVAVRAQGGNGVASVSPTVNSAYIIHTEDVLDIAVLDHPEVNRNVPVAVDGTIDYPYVGRIQVAGMTVDDLRKRLIKDLTKQFVRPQVIINVSARRALTVNIVGGGVRSAGKKPLKEGERLLEALADSGGLTADRGELFRATLFRGDQVIPIDLPKLLANDPAQNILLQPDDTIYVLEKDAAQTTVQVVGSVNHPGPIVWPRDGSLVTILQAAGGPAMNAALSKVTINRGGKDVVVDMRDYLNNGFEPSEKVEPGDRVIVPENKLEYYVFGPVGKPGVQVYPDDKAKKVTLHYALAQAGGTLEGVELKKTKIVHKDANGKETTELVDAEEMWKKGDLTKDVPIYPGDTIIVPPAGGRRGIDPFALIGGLSTLVTLYTLLHR